MIQDIVYAAVEVDIVNIKDFKQTKFADVLTKIFSKINYCFSILYSSYGKKMWKFVLQGITKLYIGLVIRFFEKYNFKKEQQQLSDKIQEDTDIMISVFKNQVL